MGATKLDEARGAFGDIVSQELAQAIRANLEAMALSFPLGEIAPIMTNIPGVSVDENIWQLCNGSEITNPNSPLRSLPGNPRYTPDLRDSFIRVAANPGLVGEHTGSHALTGLTHNHGGKTGYYETPEQADSSDDEGAAENTTRRHRHSIDPQLTLAYDIQPPYFTVAFYMKIQ